VAQLLEQMTAAVCEACATVSFKTGEVRRPSEKAIQFAILAEARDLLIQPWKFLEGEHTVYTVAGTATATLTGNSNDCGSIRFLKYDGAPLDYLNSAEFARRADAALATSCDVVVWTIKSKSNANNPIATFFGTPAATGVPILYGYRKLIDDTDPLALMPPDFINMIQAKMIMLFSTDAMQVQVFERVYNDAKAAAYDRHTPDLELPNPNMPTAEQCARNYEINAAMAGHSSYRLPGRVVDGGDLR
jgi:hypothetical protein